MPNTLAEIQEFLVQKRIALVGISRDARDFSRAVFRELEQRGYDVVPINPAVDEINGRKCFKRVQDITPRIDAALLMTPPNVTAQVVHDCAEAGIRHVWMHRASGQGAVSPEAVAFCKTHDIHLIEGYCPLMFLPNGAFIHRAHGLLMKVTGKYPAAA